MRAADAKPFDPRAFDRSLAETANPLSLFRSALRAGCDAIRERFLADRNADHLVHALAELTDALLVRAWALHGAKHPTRSPKAFIALGR